MSEWSESELRAMEELSALMDGEVDASAADQSCRQWREIEGVRASWHSYHLIGDVLRSSELASSAPRDEVFLAAFRQRMAQEPVVFAPSAAVPGEITEQPAARRSWAAPAAVAAGFVLVAGVLVVVQMSGGLWGRDTQVDTGVVEAALADGVRVVGVAASGGAAEPAAVVLNGQLIRDVRLDEYLAAHKKFGGSSVPGGPSGFLRNAAADGSAR